MTSPRRPDRAPRTSRTSGVGRLARFVDASRPGREPRASDAVRGSRARRPDSADPIASAPAHLSRRALTITGLLLPGLALAACADPVADSGAAGGAATGASDGGGASTGTVDTSGTQKLIRSTKDEAIAALVPPEIAADGKLTMATSAGGTPPLSFLADDNKTTIGSEVDIARLAADKLGLELDVQLTSWENWPLKLEAREYEVVHSNVGINAERLQKFDFASYRAAFMTFLASKDADFELSDAESITGRIIAVGNATNQEKILTAWNEQLTSEGKEPAELKNYSSDADVLLALGSGRIDAYFAPFASLTYTASKREEFVTQGKVDAGWPHQTLVAATFPRGSGLADPYAKAINALIAEGTYGQVLERWGLTEEAVTESAVHTAENP
ncbi:transporter substrate-binding domain-containing protein [Brachybacterium sp. AOP25-B2-12]|uniref:transporter substrate-binding domain-containing protein n=1 Tax=Brachybacterium sp. AOP25-B2-12 TaxID=3457710 RepID=UPI00403359C1